MENALLIGLSRQMVLSRELDIVANQVLGAAHALEAWYMIADLMALGYSKSWISAALGKNGHSLQFTRHAIKARNFMAVKRLWNDTAEPRHAQTANERTAATRSRNYSVALKNRLDTERSRRRRAS